MAQLLRITQPVCGQIFGKFNTAATWRWQHNATTNCNYDLAIVGGGIVGLAAAREIQQRHCELKIAVIEKENKLAAHQSGHTSGIIDDGLLHQPGTCSAKLCIQGSYMTQKYCDDKKIPYKKCGKLIVATNEMESVQLMKIYELGVRNKVPDLQCIERKHIECIEPFCKGIKALWCPHSSIVDWALVTKHLARDFQKAGGDIFVNSKVIKFAENKNIESACRYPLVVRCEGSKWLHARYVITCGGLQADQLGELTACPREPRIIPIRGEFLCLKSNVGQLVHGIICSVPDLCLPFLGVHFIPQINGSILLGPTAVLAFKREGYTWRDINLLELFNTLRYTGFLKMSAKHYSVGLHEMVKRAFIAQNIKAIQKYIPLISKCSIQLGPAGVYAQAVNNHGNLLNDFVFAYGNGLEYLSNRVLHCLNPPMSGATSSLAFARVIADKVEEEFEIGKKVISTYWARN